MKAKPFLIGSAILVVVIAAASFYIAATIDKFDRTLIAVASPDGKFKAIKVTVAGGGGATPFCFDTISVLLAVYPDDSVDRRKEYEIYTAPCGRFANGEPSPKIEWLSHAALRITFAPAADAKPPRTKNIDVTKSVHVEFVRRD